jgi:hypothetical protein
MAERWVTQSEAARELGVAQSSISRFLTANPDVPVKRNASGKISEVEFHALAEARSGSLSVQDKAAEREYAEPSSPPQNLPFEQAVKTPRRKDLRDEMLEMDIAERKGELLPRASIQSAVETAGLAFTQALDQRRRSLASRVAMLTDTREIELLIRADDRKLMEAIVKKLTSAADGLVIGEAEEIDAPA